MNTVEVRRADPADAPAIAALHVRSFRTAYEHLLLTSRSAENGLDGRVALWEDRLRRREGMTLVAVEADRVVGFIHFGPSSDDDADAATGHISSVHVDPSLTGKGLGGRLVEAAVTGLSDDGFGEVTLWAVAGNDRARRFYRRLGWEPDGAVRTEKLSVGEEEGDEVEIVRLRLALLGVGEA